MGGTRIETLYTLISGEDLGLSIAIYPQVIKCRAEVVYVSQPPGERTRAGVRFQEMSKRDEQYLSEYILSVREHRASALLQDNRI